MVLTFKSPSLNFSLKKPLPESLLKSIAALVSCVAGAVLMEETLRMIGQAGLKIDNVTEKAYNIDVMADCNDPLFSQVEACLPEGTKLGDYVVSADIIATKS